MTRSPRGRANASSAGEAPLKAAYLTTAASEQFGGQGAWHDLTAEQFAAAPPGLLVEPTAAQLALRIKR